MKHKWHWTSVGVLIPIPTLLKVREFQLKLKEQRYKILQKRIIQAVMYGNHNKIWDKAEP